MADRVREQLIGYLLGALEDSERESVESQLEVNPRLRRELAKVRRTLRPFWVVQPDFVPPPGLAAQTCELVAYQSARAALPSPPLRREPLPVASSPWEPASAGATSSGGGTSWSWHDLAVLAGLVLVASMLVFPAIQSSRFNARLVACQDNLRQLGLALTQYSERHEGYFPCAPDRGALASAGIYAHTLLSNGFIDDPRRMICPGSPLAEDRQARLPSPQELLATVDGKKLDQLRRLIGGSYGGCLGYMEDGQYRNTRNMRRPFFALMADTPSPHLPGFQSVNHSGRGQNVLLESCRVMFFPTPKPDVRADDIFVNDTGFIAAGMQRDDSVIVSSTLVPIRFVSSSGGSW